MSYCAASRASDIKSTCRDSFGLGGITPCVAEQNRESLSSLRVLLQREKTFVSRTRPRAVGRTGARSFPRHALHLVERDARVTNRGNCREKLSRVTLGSLFRRITTRARAARVHFENPPRGPARISFLCIQQREVKGTVRVVRWAL